MGREYKGRRKAEADYIGAAATEIGNRPPQAPEVEEAVIGAMMMDEECAVKALETLSEKSFYEPRLRLIFRAIKELANRRMAVDIATVAERLRENGVLEDAGGAAFLAEMTAKVGSAANIEDLTGVRVKENYPSEGEPMSRTFTAEGDGTCSVDGWRSVYLRVPLAVDELRKALADAGAHMWTDTSEVVAAGRGYLMVHAATDGR